MHSILKRLGRMQRIAAAILPLVALAGSARADIFQWEYINPANPGQGKRQSTTLAPDGAGVDAVPGVNLNNRNLTMAYLIGADLTGADISRSCGGPFGCRRGPVPLRCSVSPHQPGMNAGPITACGGNDRKRSWNREYYSGSFRTLPLTPLEEHS
jgi:hypothetical protein